MNCYLPAGSWTTTTFTPVLHGFSRYGRAVGFLTITGGGGGYDQQSTSFEFNGSGVGGGAQFIPIVSAGGALTGAQLAQMMGGMNPWLGAGLGAAAGYM